MKAEIIKQPHFIPMLMQAIPLHNADSHAKFIQLIQKADKI
jgi:hypothetical protein